MFENDDFYDIVDTDNCEVSIDEDLINNWKDYVFDNFIDTHNAKYGGSFLTRTGDIVYIKHVLYKKPVVMIIWNDDTRSFAKCLPCDEHKYSWEAGLNMAINNRLYGHDEMKHLYEDWLPDNYIANETEVCYDDRFEVDIKDVRKKYKLIEKVTKLKNNEAALKFLAKFLTKHGYSVTYKQ